MASEIATLHQQEKLNYVEFAAHDLKSTSKFFNQVFAWNFTWYGDDYVAFSNAGLDGGFYKANLQTREQNGGALLIFYSNDLEATLAKVSTHGAVINKAIFSFPGGRRFHFLEPSGNEFAVWSDLGLESA